jgi:hypothetical protein
MNEIEKRNGYHLETHSQNGWRNMYDITAPNKSDIPTMLRTARTS